MTLNIPIQSEKFSSYKREKTENFNRISIAEETSDKKFIRKKPRCIIADGF